MIAVDHSFVLEILSLFSSVGNSLKTMDYYRTRDVNLSLDLLPNMKITAKPENIVRKCSEDQCLG